MNYYNNFQNTLNFVGSIDEARAFLMMPNQTAYFMDTGNNMLYIKRSDNQCKTSLSAYTLTEHKESNDFATIVKELNDKIDKLSLKLETTLKNAENMDNAYE